MAGEYHEGDGAFRNSMVEVVNSLREGTKNEELPPWLRLVSLGFAKGIAVFDKFTRKVEAGDQAAMKDPKNQITAINFALAFLNMTQFVGRKAHVWGTEEDEGIVKDTVARLKAEKTKITQIKEE